MWQRKHLQHRRQSAGATPPDYRVQGIKIGVHNWTHGIETPSGFYLTPENACKAFIGKLEDTADPNRPRGNQDVLLIMVASREISEFQREIERVATILPEPAFKQAYDYAKASETLAETKMIKTPPIASPAFAKPSDITPQSGRVLQNLANQSKPQTPAGDVFGIINQLKARKAQQAVENQQKVAKIMNTSAQVYAFSQRGELAEVATRLLQNVPSADHIFTACVCFIGENLTTLKGMLHGESG